MSCQIEREGYEKQEVRVLDLSEEGFTFRLAQDLSAENTESGKTDGIFRLHFFCFQESAYHEVVLSDYRLEVEERQEFYTLYRLTTEDMEYRQSARALMREYLRYISLKLDGDEAQLSKAMVGYQAEREEEYEESFEVQKKHWFEELKVSGKMQELAAEKPFELALSLDRPSSYEDYLNNPLEKFEALYWKKQRLQHHPLAGKRVDCLYIGNQFCHLLFPKGEQLFLMLEKAMREGIRPVLAFTYMQETRISAAKKLLDALAKWCRKKERKLELVLNDWGMFSMIRENGYDCFLLTLGILLQKRRKDVRMKYKQGFEKYQKQLAESAVQAEFYREYLREHFQITRISYESCGYPVKIAPGKASLHLPFYQMNTSQHCTLYAQCHNKDRGKQTAVEKCPGYCKDRVFLYPKMLHMVGRYNSLFGYDEQILADGTILQSCLEQGVDRIVMELL